MWEYKDAFKSLKLPTSMRRNIRNRIICNMLAKSETKSKSLILIKIKQLINYKVNLLFGNKVLVLTSTENASI